MSAEQEQVIRRGRRWAEECRWWELLIGKTASGVWVSEEYISQSKVSVLGEWSRVWGHEGLFSSRISAMDIAGDDLP